MLLIQQRFPWFEPDNITDEDLQKISERSGDCVVVYGLTYDNKIVFKTNFSTDDNRNSYRFQYNLDELFYPEHLVKFLSKLKCEDIHQDVTNIQPLIDPEGKNVYLASTFLYPQFIVTNHPSYKLKPDTIDCYYNTSLSNYDHLNLIKIESDSYTIVSNYNSTSNHFDAFVGLSYIIYETSKYLVISPGYYIHIKEFENQNRYPRNIFIYNKQSDTYHTMYLEANCSYLHVVKVIDEDRIIIRGMNDSSMIAAKINLDTIQYEYYHIVYFNSSIGDRYYDNPPRRYSSLPSGRIISYCFRQPVLCHIDDTNFLLFFPDNCDDENHTIVKGEISISDDNIPELNFETETQSIDNRSKKPNIPFTYSMTINNKHIFMMLYVDSSDEISVELYDVSDPSNVSYVLVKKLEISTEIKLVIQISNTSFKLISNDEIIMMNIQEDNNVTFQKIKILDPSSGIYPSNYNFPKNNGLEIRDNQIYHLSHLTNYIYPTGINITRSHQVEITVDDVTYQTIPFDTTIHIKIKDLESDTYISGNIKLSLEGSMFKDDNSTKKDNVSVNESGISLDIQVDNPDTFKIYYDLI